MAIKRTQALDAFADAGCQVIMESLTEINNGWIAMAGTDAGRRLVSVVEGENPLKRRQAEKAVNVNGLEVEVMPLSAVNAAELRHNIKWTAPVACGVKGTSIGFSDYMGVGTAFLMPVFAKKQIRPALIDVSAEDCSLLGLDFAAVLDRITWDVFAGGYKEGYAVNAAELKVKAENFSGFNFDEDIYKVLVCGYKAIGVDCSDKIDLNIEKLSDDQVEKRFEQFNDVFRAAVDASYLKVEFKVGDSKISYQPAELHRIVLEYGEAIMHIQNVYNTFLKSAPWDIDFEIAISKPGKTLTPQEHCLIANELQRNNIKISAVCLDAANDVQAMTEGWQLHCDIAETYGYRLSIKNADSALSDPAYVMKSLKGKVHFKLNNILWMSAVKLIAANNHALYEKMAALLKTDPVAPEDVCGNISAREAFSQQYREVLGVGTPLAEEIKAYISENKEAYEAEVKHNLENNFLKRI